MDRRVFAYGVIGFGLLVCAACGGAPATNTAIFDVVIAGGRVMDPETGLDAVRHVGIREGSIVAVSESPLDDRLRDGGTRIDAEGLVVAPGFIDLHSHGMSDEAFKYRARDGVTTALELEAGYPFVSEWLEAMAGKARIHFGASASHMSLRALSMSDIGDVVRPSEAVLREAAKADEPLMDSFGSEFMNHVRYSDLPEGDMPELYRLLDRGLADGGIGIGMAHQYYPGASYREIFRVFEFAAERKVPIFVHVREMSTAAMQEVIADAATTGAPLHIVHLNSMSGNEMPVILEMIAGARERGIDITTETYPYTAASTMLDSALFDEGWQERYGISYDGIQWQDTGERLTEETFKKYRAQGGVVIIHFMKDENTDLAIRTPHVMIASDAMPYAPGAHPRSAGTFARVLGRYVRERGVIDLMTALEKMTLAPARRLENVAPAMERKGRLQKGADADIVVFDPETVIDNATFEEGLAYSTGIRHVLVAGTAVVRDEELVEGVFPGLPIIGRVPQEAAGQ
jgi:N-acyl-D-aspartate/D-glutamate deacylase